MDGIDVLGELPLRIYVGQVLKYHGVHGSVKVRPFTDRRDRFQAGSKLFLGIPDRSFVPVSIELVSPLGKDLVVTFMGQPFGPGWRDISAYWLAVDEEKALPPAQNTYFHYQLMNLQVWERGRYVGKVTDIISHSPYDFLVIEGSSGEYLLPFLAVYCRTVDLENGSIMVECPDGFWE